VRYELAGNRMRVRRPPSILTSAHETLFGAAPMADVRPMSQFAIAQSQGDPDPRYKPDNAASFDLEFLPGASQPYSAGAGKLNVAASVRTVMEAPSSAAAAGEEGPGGAGATGARSSSRSSAKGDGSGRGEKAGAGGESRSRSGGSGRR
jgi:hypothetical protein